MRTVLERHGWPTDLVQTLEEFSVEISGELMAKSDLILATSGAWTNGVPKSLTPGCGTWYGNSVSENVGYRHLMNIKWISWPIPVPNSPLRSFSARKFWSKSGTDIELMEQGQNKFLPCSTLLISEFYEVIYD